MKCRQAKNLIFDHIDGMISEPDRVALERHLNQCAECEVMASGVTKSLDLLHNIPNVEPSENFNWKLRLRLLKEKNAIRDESQTERQWYRAWNTRFAVSAVSTLALVLVAGTVLLKSSFAPVDRSGSFEFTSATTPTRVETRTPSQTARTMPSNTFDPIRLAGPVGVGPRPVAWGVTSGGRIPQVIEDSSRPILDTDSLKVRYLRTMRDYYRVRQLEQQVEVLQTELNKCNMEKK